VSNEQNRMKLSSRAVLKYWPLGGVGAVEGSSWSLGVLCSYLYPYRNVIS